MIPLSGVLLSGTIPVADLGTRPRLYTTSPLATVLLVLGAVGVIVFTAQVLGVRRRAAAGGSVWGPFIFTLVLMVVPTAVGIVLSETGKSQAMERLHAYYARVDEAQTRAIAQLEAQYGVVIGQQWNVPTQDGSYGAVDLTMADGTLRRDCLVVTDATYEIRCGNPHDPAASTPLPLPDREAAP